jgi:hypothetical protein
LEIVQYEYASIARRCALSWPLAESSVFIIPLFDYKWVAGQDRTQLPPLPAAL